MRDVKVSCTEEIKEYGKAIRNTSMKHAWEGRLLVLCTRFQVWSNMAPNMEFLPALARVVAVVSKVLPPTLNFTLSSEHIPMFGFPRERERERERERRE